MENNEIIITGRHMELTEALKNMVHQKTEKLFQHDQKGIIRMRVELEFNKNITHRDEYIAKGHIETRGPDMIVSESSDDLYKSIDSMVSKLDRMLRRRSRLFRVKRKQPHQVDIPAELPKVANM